MGVGDENPLGCAFTQVIKKLLGLGSDSDKVLDFSFQTRNIQGQLLGPVVCAVPLDATAFLFEALVQVAQRGVWVNVMMLRVTGWQVMLPEIIIKMQVEKGAVHVQQDGVNGVPVNHRG